MICVNLWGLIPACEKDLSGTLKKLRNNGADAVEGLLVPIKRDPSAGAPSPANAVSVNSMPNQPAWD